MALTQHAGVSAEELREAFFELLPLIESAFSAKADRIKAVEKVFGTVSNFTWLEGDRRGTPRWLYRRQPFLPIVSATFRAYNPGPNAFRFQVHFSEQKPNGGSFYQFQIGRNQDAQDILRQHLASHLAINEPGAPARTFLLYTRLKRVHRAETPATPLPDDIIRLKDERITEKGEGEGEGEGEEDQFYHVLVLETHRQLNSGRIHLVVLFTIDPITSITI